MKKLFLLLFSVLAFTSQVRAEVVLPISTTPLEMTWSVNLYCSKEWCNILEKDDILYGTVTINSSEYKIELDYDWTTIDDFTFVPSVGESSEGEISYTLTAEDVANLKTNGMRIRGNNYTLKTLYLKKSKSVIKTSIAASGSTGNWATDVGFPENSLKTAVENDYVMVSVTPSNDDAQGKVGMSSKGTDTYGFNSYVNAFYGIVTADMAGETTKNGYVQGKNITVNSAALYHPVNSFKIGSIGMATFSAAQEVKVPNGLTAYKATVSGNNVTLTPFTNNVIPANQGAIIEGNEGSVVEFVASNNGSTEKSALQPVITATEVTSLPSGFDYYVLYAGEKEDNLALSTLLSGISNWGGNVTVSSTEPYTAEWTSTSTSNYMGKWLGGDGNWSSYDKLRLVFTGNTVTDNVHFGISYKDQADSEDTGADLAPGELTVDIPLNKSYKKAINNFYFYSNAKSGKLTFKSATLIGIVPEFRKTESGTIAANKAYLKIEKSGTSKLNIVFAEDENKQGEEQQGETNSIRNIANTNVNNNVVYNMNGQRVGSDYKGIVIVNGKKIIKK